MRPTATFHVLLILAPLAGSLHAEDWTTVTGTTYKNVTVVSHDDGYVTILDDDGGAKIELSELPAGLRQRFNFDPVKASACVVATEAADQKDAAAVVAAKAASAEQAAQATKTNAETQAKAAKERAIAQQRADIEIQIQKDEQEIADLGVQLDAEQAQANKPSRLHQDESPYFSYGGVNDSAHSKQQQLWALQKDIKQLQAKDQQLIQNPQLAAH